MNFKQAIGLSVISVLYAATANAGEAYVRNTDIYTTTESYTEIDIKGKENYDGIRKEFSAAIKYEEFDNEGVKDAKYDVDGFAGAVSATYERVEFDGYSKYDGFQEIETLENSYTHEVSAGTR